MASKPPFELEDQTDEAFFDKLVEEDDDCGIGVGTKVGVDRADSYGSAEANAFANLSLNEAGKELDDSEERGTILCDASRASDLVSSGSCSLGDEMVTDGVLLESKVKSDTATDSTGVCDNVGDVRVRDIAQPTIGASQMQEPDKLVSRESPLMSSSSFTFHNELDSAEGVKEYKVSSGFKNTKIDDLSGSSIQEVNWSSFSDAVVHDSKGFGSYSDFFTDLGVGQVDNMNSGAEVVSNKEAGKNASQHDYNYAGYEMGRGASVGQTTTGTDSNQCLENLYPGWKFDPASGQWYQVDGYGAMSTEQQNSCAAMENIQGGFNYTAENYWTSSDGTLSSNYYAQKTLQPVPGTAGQVNATNSTSSWNQVSQGQTEYPAHMVFDPQYPGWYYDTNTQEWYSLETYNSNQDMITQTHQQLQNECTSSSTFSNVNNHVFDNQNRQNLAVSYDENNQQNNYAWQSAALDGKAVGGSGGHAAQISSSHSDRMDNYASRHDGSSTLGLSASFEASSQVYDAGNRLSTAHYTVPSWSPMKPLDLPLGKEKNELINFSADTNHNSLEASQHLGGARSSAMRPPHALVTFGFGGKLVVMKDNSFTSTFYGTQDAQGQGIFICNLMEVVSAKHTVAGTNERACSYFDALCQQSFPGPLVGGNVGGKELIKWIDERIANSDFTGSDHEKEETLKLLFSLLKIACQHNGKLRSLATDSGMRENDALEAEVAKLFASARGDAWQFGNYSAFKKCLTSWPSEAQVQATASEIQNLLVNGRKMEALQCAQEGHCWAFALILAHELGDQFYASTLKQMALSQLVAGTSLRTLCLLIAKSPAEVFESNTMDSSGVVPSTVQGFARPGQFAGSMLDNWAEHLAVITANRTENDHLVITHLGDSLWKEKSDIIAAHTCYIVAEAEFQSYSNSARLCLIGADHWNFPRTYASPEAIQRTELLEYSKVLGNSQFVLLPFQPYKILYAHMLAEVGKVSESLKYCQAVYKCLRTARSPELDALKQIISSLEDRIKTHQRGGYSVNLAPAKIFGNLLKVIDSTAQRVVGPPPVALSSQSSAYGAEQLPAGPVLTSSQSTMSIPTLTPSASTEPRRQWDMSSESMTVHSRSISEPVMAKNPTQDQVVPSKEPVAPKVEAKGPQTKSSSRFARFSFGAQLIQKAAGLLKPRQGHQAKLGDENKFYYDEKLKRWVEAGVDPPVEEAALPPPPTTLSNSTSDYNLKNSLHDGGSESNSGPMPGPMNSSTFSGGSSEIPYNPPSMNQFSARSRMGVRSRYVDTFNKGGGSPANLFPKPSVSPIKPATSAGAKFFVPAAAPSLSTEQSSSVSDAGDQEATSESTETSVNPTEDPFKKFSPLPSTTMPRFPSVDNIPNDNNKIANGGSLSSLSRRTASWNGGPQQPLGTSPQSSGGSNFSPSTTPLQANIEYDLQKVQL